MLTERSNFDDWLLETRAEREEWSEETHERGPMKFITLTSKLTTNSPHDETTLRSSRRQAFKQRETNQSNRTLFPLTVVSGSPPPAINGNEEDCLHHPGCRRINRSSWPINYYSEQFYLVYLEAFIIEKNICINYYLSLIENFKYFFIN